MHNNWTATRQLHLILNVDRVSAKRGRKKNTFYFLININVFLLHTYAFVAIKHFFFFLFNSINLIESVWGIPPVIEHKYGNCLRFICLVWYNVRPYLCCHDKLHGKCMRQIKEKTNCMKKKLKANIELSYESFKASCLSKGY